MAYTRFLNLTLLPFWQFLEVHCNTHRLKHTAWCRSDSSSSIKIGPLEETKGLLLVSLPHKGSDQQSRISPIAKIKNQSSRTRAAATILAECKIQYGLYTCAVIMLQPERPDVMGKNSYQPH